MTLHYRINDDAQSRISRRPNFLIIGAAKSGTTSLWHQLGQHPQIYMHRTKQLNFFAIEGMASTFHGPPPFDSKMYAITTWEDYCSQFSNVRDEVAVGEASNSYLYSQQAALCIRKYLPEAKLIAVLRHPVERAYSRFLQMLSTGREPIASFPDALNAEQGRVDHDWWPDFHYIHMGMYHAQLSRYFKVFPRDQIKVYLHEDMLNNPLLMLKDIFRFLNVNTEFTPRVDLRFGASGLPRRKTLDWLLRKLRKARPMAERILPESQLNYLLRIAGDIHLQNLNKPKLSEETRQWMIRLYRDDTLKLQDLLRRDLSAWLK